MTRIGLRVGAATVLTMFMLGSCGSDDDESTSTTGAAVATTASSTDGSGVPATSESTAPSTAGSTASSTADTAEPETTAGGSGDSGDIVHDPCDLLTPESVAAVLGEGAKVELAVAPEPPLYLGQCEWSIEPTELSLKAIYLSITTTEGLSAGGAGGGGYTAKDQYDGLHDSTPTAVDIPGLGDSAYASDDSMSDLHVLSGDTLLEIDSLKVGGDLEPVTPEQLRALMETALSRL
jgi:hypothetical protein